MKIWFISDTHTCHEQLRVPTRIDMVVHCGDESSTRSTQQNEPEARAFFQWYCKLDIARKIFVPGNHSTSIELGKIQPQDYPQVDFLIHQSMTVHGLNIFGSPYTPWFFDWAYNVARAELAPVWADIPELTDILVTHGPPKGILDQTHCWKTKVPIHIGSKSLTRHVQDRIRPRIHAFGHLHDEPGIRNFGQVSNGQTLYVNCACCDLSGKLVNHGHVIEL